MFGRKGLVRVAERRLSGSSWPDNFPSSSMVVAFAEVREDSPSPSRTGREFNEGLALRFSRSLDPSLLLFEVELEHGSCTTVTALRSE